MRPRATKAKRRPGRPRTRATTELVASLIGVQDALSRRTYGRIKAFWREHLRAEDVLRDQRTGARIIQRHADKIPDRYVELLALETKPDAARVRAILAAEIRRSLLAMADEILRTGENEPRREEGPPKPTRSRTLAEARAQAARLKVELMGLKGRTVPDRGP